MTLSKVVKDFRIANPSCKGWAILQVKQLVQRQSGMLVLRYCEKVLLEDHITQFFQLIYIIP